MNLNYIIALYILNVDKVENCNLSTLIQKVWLCKLLYHKMLYYSKEYLEAIWPT